MKLVRIVKRLVPVLCLSVSLVGCASTGGDRSSSLYLESAPSGVYYARSPAMQSAERELAECLFRVAGQVSLRKSVTVQYVTTPVNAPDGTRLTRAQVSVDYNQANSIAILDTLTVRAVRRDQNGTEALVRASPLPGIKTPSVQASDRIGRDGNPGWVARPPKSSGYVTAVGSIAQGASSPDGYANADTNAIGALAPLVARGQASGSSTVYEATLVGVFIARRWFNPQEGRWYSLAVLPR